MSKERLEEIEREIERNNNATLKGNSLGAERMILDLHEIGRFEWLVKHAKEQAERVQEFKRFSISKDELKEVLNSNENIRSEEHTSELQSRGHLVCRLLLEKKNL